jgi:hypothetical protein
MKTTVGKIASKPLLFFLVIPLILLVTSSGCAHSSTTSTPSGSTNSSATIGTTIQPSNTTLGITTSSAKPAVTTSKVTEGPPPATILQQEVMEVDAFQMWNDYQKDPNAAAIKYENRVLRFPNVLVDNMPYMGEGHDLEYYVQQGMVKFRTELFEVLWPIRPGFTVDIVGVVTGLKWNYLNVMMVSVVVTNPPGGVGGSAPPPEY